VGVPEVEAGDGGAGPHGVAFGEVDAGLAFDVEEVPDDGLAGVVGAGGVAGGGADALVFLGDEGVVIEILVGTEAPEFAAYLGVEKFGEGFGEAVGHGFDHDGVVVVVVGLEFG